MFCLLLSTTSIVLFVIDLISNYFLIIYSSLFILLNLINFSTLIKNLISADCIALISYCVGTQVLLPYSNVGTHRLRRIKAESQTSSVIKGDFAVFHLNSEHLGICSPIPNDSLVSIISES